MKISRLNLLYFTSLVMLLLFSAFPVHAEIPSGATPLISCGMISSPGYYYLSTDLTSPAGCFIIDSDNVILDGNGSKVIYSNSTPAKCIQVNSKNNVTIKNIKITNGASYSSAIDLQKSSNSNVLNNEINISTPPSSSTVFGIMTSIMESSSSNSITGNEIFLDANNAVGIYMFSSNSFVSDNKITISREVAGGLWFMGSNNLISNNTIGTAGTFSGSILVGVNFPTKNNIITFNNLVIGGKDSISMQLPHLANSNIISKNSIKIYSSNSSGIRLLSPQREIYENTIDVSSTDSSCILVQFPIPNSNVTYFYRNNMTSVSDHVFLKGINSTHNIFYDNYFYGSGIYIKNEASQNYFNYTLFELNGSLNSHGNYYSDIESMNVFDIDGDGYAEIGSDLPISSVSWPTKWSGSGSDFNPITSSFLESSNPVSNFTYFPLTPEVEKFVNFTSTSYDLSGILLEEWDFDEDNVTDLTGSSVTWIFNSSGNFSVSLTVTDASYFSNKSKYTISIFVSPASNSSTTTTSTTTTSTTTTSTTTSITTTTFRRSGGGGGGILRTTTTIPRTSTTTTSTTTSTTSTTLKEEVSDNEDEFISNSVIYVGELKPGTIYSILNISKGAILNFSIEGEVYNLYFNDVEQDGNSAYFYSMHTDYFMILKDGRNKFYTGKRLSYFNLSLDGISESGNVDISISSPSTLLPLEDRIHQACYGISLFGTTLYDADILGYTFCYWFLILASLVLIIFILLIGILYKMYALFFSEPKKTKKTKKTSKR